MGLYGFYHQVTPARLAELLADPSLIYSETHPSDRKWPECTVEKTWNAIQFIISYLSQTGRFPADSPYFRGGRETGASFHYGPVTYWSPAQVKVVSGQLLNVTDQMIRDAYQPHLMAENGVYPHEVWERGEDEWNIEWIRQHFSSMLDYWCKAASHGNAMLEYLG